MNWLLADKIIKDALNEDISYGDITTESIVKNFKKAKVDLISKENGIICGLDVFKRVFFLLGNAEVEFFVKDGDTVSNGKKIGEISGDVRTLLTGERVALNFLQRMSGISTLTRQFSNKLQGTKIKLLDTRKTTPNLRMFEKYAVTIGGGYNHRFGLNDGVLIKDNHIAAAGGIKNAVDMVRLSAPFVRKIEVEVENLEQLVEALDAKADIIMLDNMNIPLMESAIKIINNKAEIEVSGNVNLESIENLSKLNIDYVSTGALTHSFKVLDLSMKNLTY